MTSVICSPVRAASRGRLRRGTGRGAHPEPLEGQALQHGRVPDGPRAVAGDDRPPPPAPGALRRSAPAQSLAEAMWGVTTTFGICSRGLGVDRLLLGDVQAGAQICPACRGGDEGLLVHHGAPAGVDQDGVRLHQAQLGGPDQVVRLGRAGDVQGDEVRVLQHLRQAGLAHPYSRYTSRETKGS